MKCPCAREILIGFTACRRVTRFYTAVFVLCMSELGETAGANLNAAAISKSITNEVDGGVLRPDSAKSFIELTHRA